VVAATAQAAAEIAGRVIGVTGVARADFIVDEQGIPWFLEINTIPGMTATSLTPMAAGATGTSFEDLVEMSLKAAQLHNERGDKIESSSGPTKPGDTPLASNGH
jgi:D-alanine-D-alanine ligase-like ATP-grasp enzyme